MARDPVPESCVHDSPEDNREHRPIIWIPSEPVYVDSIQQDGLHTYEPSPSRADVWSQEILYDEWELKEAYENNIPLRPSAYERFLSEFRNRQASPGSLVQHIRRDNIEHHQHQQDSTHRNSSGSAINPIQHVREHV